MRYNKRCKVCGKFIKKYDPEPHPNCWKLPSDFKYIDELLFAACDIAEKRGHLLKEKKNE